MPATPKVSVIVPSYNHARYLSARLEGILGQTFQEFELILLDDASTDGSAAILARHADDPRVRLELNASNGGSVFRQWNRGLRLAKGELVWIAESDDEAEQEFLGTLVAQLDRHPGVGVAFCQSQVIDGEGRPLHLSSAWCEAMDPLRWKSDFIAGGPDECARYLVRQNTIPNASAAVFRRAPALAMGGAREDVRLVGDWLFWVDLLSASDLAYVARPLNRYRKHPGTVSAASQAGAVDIVESYRVARHVMDRHPVEPGAAEAARERLAGLWFDRALASGSPLLWRHHAEVYRAARTVDPAAARRFGARWLRLRRGTIRRAWSRLLGKVAGSAAGMPGGAG